MVPNIAIGYAGNLRYYGDVSSNLFLLPFRGTSAGGGYSTAHDLLKFSRCLVNNQLLNPEYTDIMLEEKVSSPIPGLGGEYAYGFMVGTINNHRVVGHGGSFPGVCTMLNIYVDLGYTSVILSNSSNDCLRVISRVHETLTNSVDRF